MLSPPNPHLSRSLPFFNQPTSCWQYALRLRKASQSSHRTVLAIARPCPRCSAPTGAYNTRVCLVWSADMSLGKGFPTLSGMYVHTHMYVQTTAPEPVTSTYIQHTPTTNREERRLQAHHLHTLPPSPPPLPYLPTDWHLFNLHTHINHREERRLQPHHLRQLPAPVVLALRGHLLGGALRGMYMSVCVCVDR